MNTAIIQFHNGQAVGDVSKKYLQSYVGMVDISVTNDTLKKVQALYGEDTQWIQVVDRAIVGAGGKWNASQEFGEDTHTLTVDEMPNHNHSVTIANVVNGTITVSTSRLAYKSDGDKTTYQGVNSQMTSEKGGGLAHNNIQQSYGMYIWVRVS